MMTDATASHFQRLDATAEEDQVQINRSTAEQPYSASRTATPPADPLSGHSGGGEHGWQTLPGPTDAVVGAAGTPLPPRFQQQSAATTGGLLANRANPTSEMSQYGGGAYRSAFSSTVAGPLSPNFDVERRTDSWRREPQQQQQRASDLDAGVYRDPNIGNATDKHLHFMERNPYYQAQNGHHSSDVNINSNIAPRNASAYDGTDLGADPTSTIPIFSPYHNRSAQTPNSLAYADQNQAMPSAGYAADADPRQHQSYQQHQQLGFVPGYNMPSAAGDVLRTVSPSPKKGPHGMNVNPIAGRLQQQALEGQSMAQRYAAATAASAQLQRQQEEARMRNYFTHTGQTNITGALVNPSMLQQQQQMQQEQQQQWAKPQRRVHTQSDFRADGRAVIDPEDDYALARHRQQQNQLQPYAPPPTNDSGYYNARTNHQDLARYPLTTPSAVDFAANNFGGLRGDSAPGAGHLNTTGGAQGYGNSSTSHLAPPPEALHAAALSLRRQEEQLNAKEQQLKMKEEELSRRELAVRQIILEALDVQGIAMVGGSVAAPNVAQALSNNVSRMDKSGALLPMSDAQFAQQSDGSHPIRSPAPGGQSPLFQSPTGVLEEQMIHFRDEFRRQRTQLRQLYEELNVRERELESAAIGVKKFEQKLKMREMELDTRERALIAEEDDIVHDAKRHAATINIGSDTMRKKLAILEEHEESLSRLMKDLEEREDAVKRREEASKEKIMAAKEAEDKIVKTLATAHDLEMKAKQVAIAADRLRIREESLWSAVTDIADQSSVREAKAMDEVLRVKDELLYMRKALDERAAAGGGGGASGSGATRSPAVGGRASDEMLGLNSTDPNKTSEGLSLRSAATIRAELEKIQQEIRAASVANQQCVPTNVFNHASQ